MVRIYIERKSKKMLVKNSIFFDFKNKFILNKIDHKYHHSL